MMFEPPPLQRRLNLAVRLVALATLILIAVAPCPGNLDARAQAQGSDDTPSESD